jgi:nucleoside-diphosphate-sugar epimerase
MPGESPVLLVTGGSGFVMGNLVRHWLESDPAARAVALDAAPPDAVAARFFKPVAGRLTMVQGDLRDPNVLARLPGSQAVTHVVHGAAVTSINRLTAGGAGLAGALPALETNVMGTARVLAWAEKLPALQRLVYVGTGSVYGPEGPDTPGEPLPEEGYIGPDGLYGHSKYAAERLAVQAARQFGLPAVAVRLSSVFGPLDRETPVRAARLAPHVVVSRALASETIRINDLSAGGDYIHAGDVAAAISLLLRAPGPLPHEVYNLASGRFASLGEMIDLVAERLPATRVEEVAEGEAGALDWHQDPAQRGGRLGAYDISRLAALGWRPRPLRDALHAYLDWLLAEQAAA